MQEKCSTLAAADFRFVSSGMSAGLSRASAGRASAGFRQDQGCPPVLAAWEERCALRSGSGARPAAQGAGAAAKSATFT